MKKILFFGLLSLPIFTGLASEVTSLNDYGKIHFKTEEQKFSENCSAKREYPEISEMKDTKIQEALNKRFKKILTVGKKLKADDCPSKDSSESYAYSNSYVFEAIKGPYLSLAFDVSFPGGSGRYSRDCRIFDLRDGKEVRPNPLFKRSALKEIQELMKASGQKEEVGQKFDPAYHPEGLTSGTSQRTEVSSFCLREDGIYVMYSPYDKFKAAQKLPNEKLDTYFKKHELITTLKNP